MSLNSSNKKWIIEQETKAVLEQHGFLGAHNMVISR